LTIVGEKASNNVVVQIDPSREEKLLSDHVYHLFGRAFTITRHEQLLGIILLAVVATDWAVK